MGIINLISDGAGSELIERALRSILTVYGCEWRSHPIDRLEVWQLNEVIADIGFPILHGMSPQAIDRFLQRYATNTKTRIYLWQLLPPSSSRCDRLIPEVEALAAKYLNVERVYLLSNEFDRLVWDGLMGNLKLEALQIINKNRALDLLPYLNLESLEYTDRLGLVKDSMILTRTGSADVRKKIMLFKVILDRMPSYLLL
jgi:hypothetical protein